MPALLYEGKIVCCFRVYAQHISFYPYSGSILPQFSTELTAYKTSVGTQLPEDKKLPKLLLCKIIRARMQQIRG